MQHHWPFAHADDAQRARKRIKLPSLTEEAAPKSDKRFQQHMDGIKESEAGQAEGEHLITDRLIW